MRADPVHLRVEGDALRLYDASMLGVTAEEAAALAAALQQHFASRRPGVFDARRPIAGT